MYIRWSLSDSGHIGSHFFAIAVKKKKSNPPSFRGSREARGSCGLKYGFGTIPHHEEPKCSIGRRFVDLIHYRKISMYRKLVCML